MEMVMRDCGLDEMACIIPFYGSKSQLKAPATSGRLLKKPTTHACLEDS